MKTNRIISAMLALAVIFAMAVSSSAYAMKDSYTTLYYGSSDKLLLDSEYSAEDVTFTTSDPSVAIVSSDGTVQSKGVGDCVITCTVNETGETDECTVHVQLVWWEPFKNIVYFVRSLLSMI